MWDFLLYVSQYLQGMNKTAVNAAVIAAVAIGVVVGIIGTTGGFSPSTHSNNANTNTQPGVTQQNTNQALKQWSEICIAYEIKYDHYAKYVK